MLRATTQAGRGDNSLFVGMGADEVETLDTFDIAAAEGLSATQVHTLARGEWVTHPEESDPRGAYRHWQDASGDRARRRGH